jgi:hypothetical protein
MIAAWARAELYLGKLAFAAGLRFLVAGGVALLPDKLKLGLNTHLFLGFFAFFLGLRFFIDAAAAVVTLACFFLLSDGSDLTVFATDSLLFIAIF